jgi:hypothetical protein
MSSNLVDKLMDDLKVAMKDRDSVRTNTIRMVRAQMKDMQIAKGAPLTPDDEISVLNNAAKKRKEAIAVYEKSNRPDLLEKEKAELKIIAAYLPEQLSTAEVEDVVTKVIQEIGATTQKDLGKVMQGAMVHLKGKADGKLVQEVARKKLA